MGVWTPTLSLCFIDIQLITELSINFLTVFIRSFATQIPTSLVF
jgi:hypothetical protein